MSKVDITQLLNEVREKTPRFLELLQGEKKRGFFRWSPTGDYFSEEKHWGLANSVFALKIYYTLGVVPENLDDIVSYINSFQREDGLFVDKIIVRRSLPRRIYRAIRYQFFAQLSFAYFHQAQTRQAVSALRLFDKEPVYRVIPPVTEPEKIKRYIDNLDWSRARHAASQLSHLVFLLANDDNREGVKVCMDWIHVNQQADGFWYTGKQSSQEKVNGAMKVVTALVAASEIAGYNDGVVEIPHADQIIDGALENAKRQDACDHFNTIYVLHHAAMTLDRSYRHDEIIEFARYQLDEYRKFYFPEHGAFSFEEGHAEKTFYGAPITKGNKEPDIHGTVMFLWGLSIIEQIENAQEEQILQEFIA